MESKINKIVGTNDNPVQLESGQVIINKKSTKKYIKKLVEINEDGENKTTTDGTDGGILKGKPHYDKNGNPTGGIPAKVDGERTIEVEGDEFVVNKEASEKHWKELSKINTDGGNGVPINKPSHFDDDPQEYKKGGKIIEFNPNHVPPSHVIQYALKIKNNHPKIWKLGGNIFGNEAFENLYRAYKRGYWLDSEEWMYIKWRSYVARHKRDFRIEGVIAMLKWADKVEKGWSYMKNLIQERIDKSKANKKFNKGGLIAPNGNKSNLTPEQYKLVRTPKFKEWFGDWENSPESASKVVDENGEPMVVYHGTTKDFNEFNYSQNAINDFGIEGRGFYFSNKEGIAKQYAKRYIKELNDFDSTNGRVIEVFLKIVNPASRNETSVLMSRFKDFKTNAKETQIELIKKGFNGVIKKYPSGDNAYEFVVFESEQIKLADGTNTTFDGSNPDIRFKDGGNLYTNCIDYIKNSEAIKNNGYYSEFKNLNVYVGAGDKIVPKEVKNLFLITYNSSGQKNLKAIDTINSKELANELAKLLKIEIGIAKIIVSEQAIYSKRFDIELINSISDKNIVIADRDKIVCENISNIRLKDGGGSLYHLGGDMSKHLAPNGKPSNLTHEQWHLVRTPEFKAWFGDWENNPSEASKVVDENGEPLLVYHGSKKTFEKFDIKKKGSNTGINNSDIIFFASNIETAKSPLYVNYKSDKKILDKFIEDIKKTHYDNFEKISKIFNVDKNKLREKFIQYFSDKELLNLDQYINDYITDTIEFNEGRITKSDYIKAKNAINLIGMDERNVMAVLEEEFDIEYSEEKENQVFELIQKNIDFYLKRLDNDIKLDENSKIYKAFLNIRKPEIIDEFEEGESIQSISEQKSNKDGNIFIDTRDGGRERSNIYSVYDESQIKAVEQYLKEMPKYADSGNVLLAPNGKPSNLTPEQYRLVRTPSFKAWFGDWENSPETSSKVVDEETKEPKVMYHGSPNDFTIFNPKAEAINRRQNFEGFYFAGKKDRAKSYSNVKLFEVFINIRNPLNRHLGEHLPSYKSLNYIREKYKGDFNKEYLEEKIFQLQRTGRNSFIDGEDMTKILIMDDYDGVFDGSFDYGDTVAFYPNQIKLADGTNTTFDGSNPDIRFKDGGTTKAEWIIDGKEATQEDFIEIYQRQQSNRYGGGFDFNPKKVEYLGDNEGSIRAVKDYNRIASIYDRNGEFKQVYMKAIISKALNETTFVKFGNAFRKHINSSFKAKNHELNKNSWREVASYVIGDIDYNISENDFRNFAKELGIDIPKNENSNTNIRFKDGGNLSQGVKVEKEHKNLYELFKKDYEMKEIEMPVSEQEFYSVIAKEHITENPEYYSLLQKYVEKKALGGEVEFKLQTPTGEPSKLTYMQQVLVRTESFKKWFGDWETAGKRWNQVKNEDEPTIDFNEVYKNVSKVIDWQTLEPKIVWHGTRVKDEFFSFDISRQKGVGRPYGYFAEYKEYSLNFTQVSQSGTGNEPFLYECFLNIRKPFNAIDSLGSKYVMKEKDADSWLNTITGTIVWDELRKVKKDSETDGLEKAIKSQIHKYLKDIYGNGKLPFWVSMARDINSDFKVFLLLHKYDGIQYTEEIGAGYDPNNHAQFTPAWTIFLPTQVKLADGRNLNFNPMYDDIRMEEGGEVGSNHISENTSKKEELGKLLFAEKYAKGGDLKPTETIQMSETKVEIPDITKENRKFVENLNLKMNL